jgi:predicted house-cleaning noncanonical NTP pyrophosphatase (MazG superfamily)
MLDDTSPNTEQDFCLNRIEAANEALKVARAAVHGMEMDDYVDRLETVLEEEIYELLKNNPYGEHKK